VQRCLSNGVRLNYRVTDHEPKSALLRLLAPGGRASEKMGAGPDGFGAVVLGACGGMASVYAGRPKAALRAQVWRGLPALWSAHLLALVNWRQPSAARAYACFCVPLACDTAGKTSAVGVMLCFALQARAR